MKRKAKCSFCDKKGEKLSKSTRLSSNAAVLSLGNTADASTAEVDVTNTISLMLPPLRPFLQVYHMGIWHHHI